MGNCKRRSLSARAEKARQAKSRAKKEKGENMANKKTRLEKAEVKLLPKGELWSPESSGLRDLTGMEKGESVWIEKDPLAEEKVLESLEKNITTVTKP